MVDLTVIILTKNEEKNIEKCIKSFKGVAKRFVIVDSYSDDNTENICKRLDDELKKNNVRVDFYQNKWVDHSTQLNWGINHTNISTEWTMRIDADEELLPELVEEMQQKIPKMPKNVNGIILRRRLIFMGKWIKHGGRYPELLLRIWRTGYGKCETKVMDEHMVLTCGKMVTFENDLQDNNQKNLEWWINKHNWYSNLEVIDYEITMEKNKKGLISDGKTSKQAEVKRAIKNKGYYKLPLFFRAYIYYVYRYYIKLGFLDGKEGKIFHFLQAYWYRFLVDAKMYESQKKNLKLEKQGDLKA